MPAFISPGTPVANRIFFNSGTMDFGTNRIVMLDSITIKTEWSTADLFAVGSIMPQAKNRHTFKCSVTGKVKSWAAEMFSFALGSSAAGSPNTINPLDGQPTLLSPVFTAYDANLKEYQYQFTGAIFKSISTAVKMEDYGEFDFEMEAMGLTELYTS